jgi:hypothetical protein
VLANRGSRQRKQHSAQDSAPRFTNRNGTRCEARAYSLMVA